MSEHRSDCHHWCAMVVYVRSISMSHKHVSGSADGRQATPLTVQAALPLRAHREYRRMRSAIIERTVVTDSPLLTKQLTSPRCSGRFPEYNIIGRSGLMPLIFFASSAPVVLPSM